jgi:WD40 repeat protein
MLSPHESLLVNQRRGLLAAVLATPATALGIVDIYDVKTDCRHPRKLSSSPTGVLGHESGFSPDGRTFWTASSSASLVAIDLSNPARPKRIFQQFGVVYHGLRLSADGRTMYVAHIGTPTLNRFSNGGLRILDVSQVQDRKPNPKVTILSSLGWREGSIPQAAEPFTRNGHRYVLEVDEYANFNPTDLSLNQLKAPVGAARIINVDDSRNPYVVSDLRLQVHQPANRAGDQQNDPGAIVPVQGYTAHYCSVPYRDNPKVVACSMNLSGLRVFDIRDLRHPKEVAYFNRPIQPLANPLNPLAIAGYAMSQNTWDVKRRSIWYTDVNSGFYVVRLTNGVGRLLDR